jgi:hypothetical protein
LRGLRVPILFLKYITNKEIHNFQGRQVYHVYHAKCNILTLRGVKVIYISEFCTAIYHVNDGRELKDSNT